MNHNSDRLKHRAQDQREEMKQTVIMMATVILLAIKKVRYYTCEHCCFSFNHAFSPLLKEFVSISSFR